MGVPGIADVAGSEANVRIEKAQGVNDGGRKNLRVRVNLPFCPNTCQYCAMPSDYATAMLMPDYCKALEREVELSGRDMADYEVTSVYLGGGIATYIKAERLCSIVDALRASFALAPDVEITMRALLGYVDEFKLRDCQKAGISKIDVDYHFWDPHAVRFTGRQALPEQSMATVRAFAHYGYADVSYELFYGIPGQSQEHWVAELERVLGFEPAHLVLMPMRVPPGSVLEHELANLHAAYGDRSQYRMPDAQALACMLEHAQYVLADRGYEEYLSGAFCLPGHRRKYLLDEAAGVECLSLGCGGISCVDGVCSRTTSDIERYTQHPGDLGAIIEDVWVAG